MTERQAAGLANMETYLGIRNARTEFADNETFDAYWQLVARRCDAAKRTRTTETAAERAAKQQRRDERIAAHYQDPEHLFAYGCDYATRYQPSVAKLRQKLVEKSGNADLSDQVMLRFAERLDDALRAMELAEMMQRQGRHAQAIRSKLRQRLFASDVIERCLQILTAPTGSLLDGDALVRKVQRLQRKGLSQQAMRSKLMGSAADGPAVRAAMTETLGEQGDDRALRLAIAKYERKNLVGRDLIQRLIGKGFRYAEVTKTLAALAAAREAADS